MNTAAKSQQSAVSSQPVFCTLMGISNGHLTKDVGLIPYGMYKYEGYDACNLNYTDDFPNLKKYVSGLRIELLPRRTGNYRIDSCLWLIKNAKRIDVLNLYHMAIHSVFQAAFYRLFNRKGKIYFKCDGCPTRTSGRVARYFIGRIIKFILGGWLIRNADVVSTEFQENVEVLRHEWGVEAVCVPNPINPNEIHDYRPFSERSNTIFYAGRIEREKGTHTLLEAFAKIAANIPNWSLKLAGSIPEQNIIDNFRAEHPELTERVIITGHITNRNELASLYEDAKIFAFPSRHESFGIAQMEAMSHGCFLVCTNIPASERLTQNFTYGLGSEVDDIDGMAKNLLYACTHESETESLARQGRDYILQFCSLERISHVLAQALK